MNKINSKESIGKLTQELSDGILYFAYGSNLSVKQMNQRCPNSVKIGKGILKNYKWIINSRGYANVVKSTGDYVEGTVYRITKHDENTLDRKEGVKLGGYKKKILVVLMRNYEHECLVYIDPITEEEVMKSGYEKRINAWIMDSILSPHYIEKYIRKLMPDCSFDDEVETSYAIFKEQCFKN